MRCASSPSERHAPRRGAALLLVGVLAAAGTGWGVHRVRAHEAVAPAAEQGSTSNVVVPLEAQAGRRYQIMAEPIREGFWNGMIPGEGSWVAWVEDTETHAVVSGQKASGLFTTTLEPPVTPATK